MIFRLYFLCHFFTFSNTYILLYHTENSPSIQYYDCMYGVRFEFRNIKYCRQFNESQQLQRDFNQSCHNGGHLWSFKDLFLHNVLASDVLQWSSSMEQTDRYSKYLSNTSLDVGDEYICNCTNPASFGKYCEYEFYNGMTSFDDAIKKQFEPLKAFDMFNGKIHTGSQLHNNRPCYMTLECNSGLMCLDWRHICDGKQQCMDGLDEDHCEVLEFNECENDEYRCLNGMCIPEKYWLDGGFDCMDWTDEIDILIDPGFGCYQHPGIICDEHLCPYRQWSCGDGQCIRDQTDRHTGIIYGQVDFCQNLRDMNYMCEAVTRDSQTWWTIDGGYCLPYLFAYQTLGLDTTTTTDTCAFSVKCVLSGSLNQDCTCKDAVACRNTVMNSCRDWYILYPESGPLLTPYVYMLYARDHDWTNKKPTILRYKGRVKCIGYQLIINSEPQWWVTDGFPFYDYTISEYRLCGIKGGIDGYRNYSRPRYDLNCWNNSKTFDNRSYQVSFLCETRCISKYRVRDGIRECYSDEEDYNINNSCPQIQRHRFQCSSSELTCLLTDTLGRSGSSRCSNKRDHFDYESGIVLSENIDCYKGIEPACVYLRNYIRMSSSDSTNRETIANKSVLDDYLTIVIPFRSYCDSFFDTRSGIDELPEFCEKWICSSDEYQCLSGQCILQSWVCDGEWDCSDGSDEQRIFILDHLSEHNSKLMNLIEMKKQCYQHYHSNNTPFSDICNLSSEYPCFRSGVDDPYQLTLNRPCINLTQIGDGTTDCLSGLDERNRLQCAEQDMLGFHFQFSDHLCGYYSLLCTNSYPWPPGNNIAYDTVCFHQKQFFKNGTVSDCRDTKDVMCLNDVCIKNARCNGEIECSHGEDEYRCAPQDKLSPFYRGDKKQKQWKELQLRNYPSKSKSAFPPNDTDQHLLDFPTKLELVNHLTTVYEKRHSTVKTVYEIVRDSLPDGSITFEEHYLPFICNRGLAIKYYTGHTVCFCPPSFYGAQCEFSSDRITILTHLDLVNYRSTPQIAMIKVLATFLFVRDIIDYHEFHVFTWSRTENNYVKEYFYFLYPRTEMFLQMKKTNRSGTHLYSVRFEAFNLYINERIEPIGVWQYPIYLDFLPAFRLAKILRFRPAVSPLTNDPCFNHRCGKNGICQEILNSNRSLYFCSCHSGYHGIYCESYDEECNKSCSPKSLCKPKYHALLTENQRRLCLCPASTFGSTCYIKNEKCQQNPCLHGGTCTVMYHVDDINRYFCTCPNLFRGDHCEYLKEVAEITIRLSSESMVQTTDIVAVTVFYTDYEKPSLRLNVRDQLVASSLPSRFISFYNDLYVETAPTMAIMKVYGTNYQSEKPKYYILYYQPEQKEINITIDLTFENYCPLVQTLWHLLSTIEIPGYSDNSTLNSTTEVFFYHYICRGKRNTNTTFRCFRDLNYLCICEADYHRAECFQYDQLGDQCSRCMSNGYCLTVGLDERSSFLCLCPRCHHGKRCEYSTELLSFTLDSLIVKDIQNNSHVSSGIYITIAILIFLFGLFNNFSSFLTFLRQKPRKFGVGNYLFLVSIIDQCSLLLLLLKIIHIILGTNGTLFPYNSLNRYWCKIGSYFLSIFTRLTYWLTSFVTIERLCIVLFPTSLRLKNPRLALGVSTCAVLIVCGMHIHEVFYYTTIDDLSYTSVTVTLCVTNYTQSFVSIYNRVNVLLHYFLPFLIQVISITIMIIQTACSRARTSGNRRETFVNLFKKQLKSQKELYVTPMIIVLSSLPQTILSFSYACTELKQSWQRYTLLATYFLSYLPQMLGFILYVLPSSNFSAEFRQTIIGKRLFRQQENITTKAPPKICLLK